ncbi:MAG: metal-dependent phosphohydrolase [Planctomycetaceae bacterium]|nr:metal-dependent phosphohydrolase [Planctomycetaceae bacterium]
MDNQALQTSAERERAVLARYAMFSNLSEGRRYQEPAHPYRSPFQRDRDRIVHSAAYRRLSGKMQVFTGDMGDYHRTRLTHTQEVASIARTMGRALRINEDLVEALALFHDIGHPPFGHAGEDALAECLADDGGFSHNQYALTIAEELETRHQSFPGLNLTREVLAGQASRVHKDVDGMCPLLEAQVVEAADSMTYDAHDLDDALQLGLVMLEEVQQQEMIRICVEMIEQQGVDLGPNQYRRALIHTMLDCQVTNVLENAGPFLAQSGWTSISDVRQSDYRIGTVGQLSDAKKEMEVFLYERVYRHPELIKTRERAQDQIHTLFDTFVANPDPLPKRFKKRIELIGLRRSVGDYIAGMTDRFFEQQFLGFVG